MVQVISSTTQKSKKVYEDDGWEEIWEWISGGCHAYDHRNKRICVPFSELRMAVKLRSDREAAGKINQGEEYVRQWNKYEGQVYVWRTKKIFYDWLVKYGLFPEL